MTEEKFELFEIYQKNIHHEDDKDPDGFDRFLVESPLLVRDFIYYHDGIFSSYFVDLVRGYTLPRRKAESLTRAIRLIPPTLPIGRRINRNGCH